MADSATLTAAPALAIDEAHTFAYPNDDRFEFRPYQLSLVREAFQQNLLASLPTGTGKTLVAAVVMHNFLRWFPDGLVIFMAMTRPLVQQQIKACTRCVGLPLDIAHVMTGEDVPAVRRKYWTNGERRLIFCTPHVLKNDLKSGLIDARRVVCAVFDEAHHAAKSTSPYGQVASMLHEANGFCRVLALSATAGRTLKQVQAVIDTLQIARCVMRTEADLKKYLHHRELRIVLISKPMVAQSFAKNGGGGGKTSASKSGGRGGGGGGSRAPTSSLRELLLLYGEAQLNRLRQAGCLPGACELATLDGAQMHDCWELLERRLAASAQPLQGPVALLLRLPQSWRVQGPRRTTG